MIQLKRGQSVQAYPPWGSGLAQGGGGRRGQGAPSAPEVTQLRLTQRGLAKTKQQPIASTGARSLDQSVNQNAFIRRQNVRLRAAKRMHSAGGGDYTYGHSVNACRKTLVYYLRRCTKSSVSNRHVRMSRHELDMNLCRTRSTTPRGIVPWKHEPPPPHTHTVLRLWLIVYRTALTVSLCA